MFSSKKVETEINYFLRQIQGQQNTKLWTCGNIKIEINLNLNAVTARETSASRDAILIKFRGQPTEAHSWAALFN